MTERTAWEALPAKELVEYCRAHHLTVATAESCTGGLVAALMTDVAGSSAVFLGSCVTYTNAVKHALLGVPEEIFARESEVSAACAASMAEGVRRRLGTDLAVSTTGYAGPGGGTEQNPVGTVYLAVSSERGTLTERFTATAGASRTEVRREAALRALTLLGERARSLTDQA